MNAECRINNPSSRVRPRRTWRSHMAMRLLRPVIAGLAMTVVLSALFFITPVHVQGARLDLGIEYGSLTGLGTREVRETVATLITVALGFLGIVAVVIIMAGGFFWMTSQGSEEKIEKAKGLILGGVVGLAIILSAYAIANFVIRSLERATIGP